MMSEKHTCPVCGLFKFEYAGCLEICDICNWQDDIVQLRNPDETCCANQMSLNEAREAWAKGLSID